MKVIGYGDNVMDRYVNQNVQYPGGNCINFAVYAKKIGVDSAYLGYFGEDEEAVRIKSALHDMGVDISCCKTQKGTVTERCDVNIEDGNRVFLDDDERENLHGALPIGEREWNYLNEFELIHCSCYAEENDQLPKLKNIRGIVTFDFAVEEEFRTEDYLEAVCPYIDFGLFSCEGMKNEDIKHLLRTVHEKGPEFVLATMGPDGQILFDGMDYYTGTAKYIKAKDTMGAGDSFFTAFLMSLLKSGWRKNSRMSKDAINRAFSFAAEYAADNCLIDGSFGYGSSIC